MLSLNGIRAGYDGTDVLHGVDLVVPPGSSVALFGTNGAGKSTLLGGAAGLLRRCKGEVHLGGQRIDHLSANARARLGLCLIPEGRAIFRHLSVRENLLMYVRGRGASEALERAAAAFPILRERLNQQAGTMSGGQQQMLALARAFVTSPRVVMADELSLGLAPVAVDEIFDAIHNLRASGVSLLIVEQYVDRALKFADYVYVLDKGGIVYVGEPATCQADDLFRRYLGTAAEEIPAKKGRGADRQRQRREDQAS